MSSELEKRLRSLSSACDDLGQKIRKLSYSKSPDAILEERARKALAHLQLAKEVLGERATKDSPQQAGRVFGRLGSMVDRLAGGSARKHMNRRAKLAGSIASMRKGTGTPFSPGGGVRGTSKAISIPEFLGLLHLQAKSGTLSVALPGERVHLQIAGGDVVEAYSDNTPSGSRLGEILVAQGAVESEVLDAFFVYHSGKKGRLGRALEISELVTEDQLRKALTEQVMRLIRRMTDARDAQYVFHEGRVDESNREYRIQLMELLLECARSDDESEHAAIETPVDDLPSLVKEATSTSEPSKKTEQDQEPDLSDDGRSAEALLTDEERAAVDSIRRELWRRSK